MPPFVPFDPEPIRLPLALEIFLTAWFFSVGGCIGSFMNVVIYRLPRGRSVVSPASRCPGCGNAIRSYDNLPILSWLWLRGRCRDCGTSIAARYPIVELIVALLFMTMAVEALFDKGPWWLLNFVPGTFLSMDWPRLALAYIHYMLLLCTLICAAYMAWDGQRVPLRLYVPAMIVAALVTMYWNEVRPLAVSPGSWQETAWWGLREGASGAALGFVLGVLFDTLYGLRNAPGEPRGAIRVALATTGWMLGTKAIPLIVVAAAPVMIAWFFLSGRRWRSAAAAPLVGVAVATTALVLAGRVVFQPPNWPPAGLSERALSVIAAVAALVAAGILRALAPPPEVVVPASNDMPTSSPDVMYP